MQNNYQGFYFIANYHALTSYPTNLKEYSYDIAASYIALGLDPEKSTIFLQSDVMEHLELYWYLSTVTPIGLLERAHSYKDKLANGLTSNHALFSYPILQAADILLYDADVVPVGKDQKQHIEYARDIAIKFNNQYGQTFKLPEPLISSKYSTIKGTDGKKMSKSYNNTIDIFADEKKLKKQINKIATDSKELEEIKDPDNCMIFKFYELFGSKTQIDTLRDNYLKGNFGYGHAKKHLFEVAVEHFKEARLKRQELLENEDYLDSVLKNGAVKARAACENKMKDIRERLGIFRT